MLCSTVVSPLYLVMMRTTIQFLEMTSLQLNSCGRGGVPRARFLASAYQELSVAMCEGNGLLVRAGLDAGVSVSGKGRMLGLARPSADV